MLVVGGVLYINMYGIFGSLKECLFLPVLPKLDLSFKDQLVKNIHLFKERKGDKKILHLPVCLPDGCQQVELNHVEARSQEFLWGLPHRFRSLSTWAIVFYC